MNIATYMARITEPLSFAAADGRRLDIPIGPCLVERISRDQVDIVWGPSGESSAVLPVEDVKAAADSGRLVLLE